MTDLENENTDRNLDYLHGRMSAAERQAFETEVNNSPDLKRQLGLDIVIKDELTRREELKKKFDAIFDEIDEETPIEVEIINSNEIDNPQIFKLTRSPNHSFPSYWLAAASVALVLGASVWYWNSQKQTEPAEIAQQKPTTDTTAAPKPTEPTVEKVIPVITENRELALAEKLYNDAFDGGSLVAMRGDGAITPSRDSAEVVLAIGLLKNNKTDEATKKLSNLAQRPANQWQEAAEWYLALAYLKKGQLKSTTKLVKLIEANPDHRYSLQAMKLAKQLK
jgi:hypothetical protein